MSNSLLLGLFLDRLGPGNAFGKFINIIILVFLLHDLQLGEHHLAHLGVGRITVYILELVVILAQVVEFVLLQIGDSAGGRRT